MLLNVLNRSCPFHGAIGPAAGRETVAGAAGPCKAKSGCRSPMRLRSGRWHHWLGWRVTTSAFRKPKRSCEWTNASPGLGKTESTYSTSRAAKYLAVYSLHAGAKKKRNVDLTLLSLTPFRLCCSPLLRHQPCQACQVPPAATPCSQLISHLAARYQIISSC